MSSVMGDHALVIEGAIMYGFLCARCVTFAFQNLGIDVCQIVPANYSNNMCHKHFVEKTLSVEDIAEVYETLKKNDLLRKFTIIKSGYLETTEELELLGEIVADIKKINPTAIYVCDPVEGDNGKPYKTLRTNPTPIYKEVLLPLADIATPNQFEVERLSGMTVNSEDDALTAIQIIHDMGPSIVIMTSGQLNQHNASTQSLIGSRLIDGTREIYRINFEYVDGYFCGTGDLFAGCFVGYLRQADDFKTSLEQAVSTMQHICQHTYKYAEEIAGPGIKASPDMVELRIVQCAEFLRKPTITHHAIKLL